eukprot:CFRG7331T1
MQGLRQRKCNEWDDFKKNDDVKRVDPSNPDLQEVYNTPKKRFLLTPPENMAGDVNSSNSISYVSPSVRNTVLFGLIIMALLTRFYKLAHPHSVVFDEVHFGKFASYYLRGTWFFDVHPPLGKLLFAAAGYLAGYDGSFSFKEIHMDYLKHDVPYVAMRSVSALSGALLVPLAFKTLQYQGHSFYGSFMAAVLVLLDNSLLTQSRFILLDMPMLLFISLAIFADAKTRTYWNLPFTRGWWSWLGLTGVFLGLALSVKWVGLFVVAFVGVHTIQDLWYILCNRDNAMFRVAQHFLARLLCLIIIPVVLYVYIFSLHLQLLTINGPGVTFMGPGFGDYLQKPVYPNEKQIKFGSHITMRSTRKSEQTIYLHSHNHLYRHPDGSGQQQVTGYAHKDHNNWFELQHISKQGDFSDAEVKHGDVVHLAHVPTGKAMYMHGFSAPMTKGENVFEVSMDPGVGHEFMVQIDRVRIEKSRNPIMRKHKKFVPLNQTLEINNVVRFVHVKTGCALSMPGTILPRWGYSQFEVVCEKGKEENGTTTYGDNTEFSITEIQHANLQKWNELKAAVKPTMDWNTRLYYIGLYQAVAWDTNKRLSKDHIFGSRPQDWPLLRRGVSYWQDGSSGQQIYLIGNPVVYFLCFASPLLYVIIGSILAVRARRGYVDLERGKAQRLTNLLFLWVGMGLHFFPFFLMERQLFFHHYLPAHYFMILALAGFLDEITKTRVVVRYRWWMLSGVSLCILWGFYTFAHLAYAWPIDYPTSQKLRWRSTWDMMRIEDPKEIVE